MAFHLVDLNVYSFLFAGLVIVIAVYTVYQAALPKPLPGIPHNSESASRFFGDVPLFKKARYRRQWLWNQPREHGGPVSQVFLFPFRRPTVLVTDYREVVDICSRRSKEFDRGSRNKECIGVVAPNFHFTMQTADPRLQSHKKLVRDLMAPKFLKQASAPHIYDKTIALIALWNLKTFKSYGRPFSVGNDIYSATLDMICAVAFGMDDTSSALQHEFSHVKTVNPTFPNAKGEEETACFPPAPITPELEGLFNIPEMVSIAQASPFPSVSQTLALLNPKHARAHWNRKTLIMRQTDKSLQRLTLGGSSECKSALDQLLWREMNAAKEAGRLPDYYSPVIRDELLGYLLGGHDSTAATLCWWVKYMSTYQSVQTRLRDALRQAHREAYQTSRLPTMDEIADTTAPYLDAVMEETLRYASVATLIVRMSTCDTQILGYQIPKGTDIMMALTGPSITEPALPIREMSRTLEESKDKVLPWEEDVSQFKPERWLKLVKNVDGEEEEVFDPQAGPNLAFSVGPRQCFGKKLACMKLRVVMTLLVWSFEFSELNESLNGPGIIERLVNLPKDCYVKLARA
ncbi:cytochrome P450 [Trichoderma austrokoningii]